MLVNPLLNCLLVMNSYKSKCSLNKNNLSEKCSINWHHVRVLSLQRWCARLVTQVLCLAYLVQSQIFKGAGCHLPYFPELRAYTFSFCRFYSEASHSLLSILRKWLENLSRQCKPWPLCSDFSRLIKGFFNSPSRVLSRLGLKKISGSIIGT